MKYLLDSNIVIYFLGGLSLGEKALERLDSICRKTVKIKLADEIIAATAITNNLTLLTRNVNDFDGVDGLKIENPFDW